MVGQHRIGSTETNVDFAVYSSIDRTKLDISIHCEEDVASLQVSVDDMVIMEIDEGLQSLLTNHPDLGLCQRPLQLCRRRETKIPTPVNSLKMAVTEMSTGSSLWSGYRRFKTEARPNLTRGLREHHWKPNYLNEYTTLHTTVISALF